MYKEKKDEKRAEIIDLDKARLNQDFSGFGAVEQKQKDDRRAQNERFEEITKLVHEKVKSSVMVLYREKNQGTHCAFSKDLDPFDDLLPMFLSGIMTVVDTHKLDGLNYVSAIFTSVYTCLMEEAQCKMCSKLNAKEDRCECKDDCENCPKND